MGERVELTGAHFTLSVDPATGVFGIRRHDGTVLLEKATARIHTPAGPVALAAVAPQRVTAEPFADALGRGRALVVRGQNAAWDLAIDLRLVAYDSLEAVTIDIDCANLSPQDRAIHSIEPLRAVPDNGGRLLVPGVSTCLTNGAMYYDAGRRHRFGTAFDRPAAYGETKGGNPAAGFDTAAETVDSWWNLGLFSGYHRPGLVLGFIENTNGLGRLRVARPGADHIAVTAESVHQPGFVLQPGRRIASNRLAIVSGADPYAALETYAALAGAVGRARTGAIANGWCSWFYTYEHVSADEILANARFAARHLKPYGFEYIQVDEGWQQGHGQWEANGRFARGMQWLAEQIRGLGLKAGIWVAPYVVSEEADIFSRYPEWLLKDSDGGLLRVGPWPDENSDWARHETPKRYGLDITHPGAAQWLHELMDKIAKRWGFEMVKIDFVAWSLLSADRFRQAGVTPAQAYRKGYEIIRAAVGPRCHLLECGPGPLSTGLIDSMRIELDQNYGYADATWQQYFGHSASSGPAAAKRYYFHNRTWVNDADHLCLHLLTLPQARAAASLIGLSGGNVMAGDRLSELDPVKLEILTKVLPSFGQAARPVDLLDSDRPGVLALEITKPFGQWTVAGFFNGSLTDPVVYRLPLARLGLEGQTTYLVYDFWDERFAGEIAGDIRVAVPPGSVKLLAFHAKSGLPQVVSTSRHVVQGAFELETVVWDPVTATLSGVSTGPPGTSHHVAVYLPGPRPWRQGAGPLFRDRGGYCLNRVDSHIVRVILHFNKSRSIQWRVGPDD